MVYYLKKKTQQNERTTYKRARQVRLKTFRNKMNQDLRQVFATLELLTCSHTSIFRFFKNILVSA